MIKIAVVDDSPKALEWITDSIMKFARTRVGNDFFLDSYTDGYDLLESKKNYDLYLLDIVMTTITGIDLAKKIRASDDKAIIVFLTTSPDFTIEAFDVHAFHYILKQRDSLEGGEKFFTVMSKVFDQLLEREEKYLTIKTTNGVSKVYYHNICSIESLGHNLIINLDNGTKINPSINSISLTSLTEALTQEDNFILCHRSFLVNLSNVTTLINKEFVTKDKKAIPIAKNNYAKIKDYYLDFLFKRGADEEW